MNIDARYDEREFDYPMRVGESQIVVECEIDTSDRGGITKILKVTGCAIPMRVDTSPNAAKVYGKVSYRVLYLSEDNNVVSLEYASDFVENIAGEDIAENAAITPHVELVDIDSMVKGESIRIQAVVDIHLDGVKKCKADIMSSIDGALSRREDVKTCVHICHVDERFDVTEDYSTGANVDRVLNVNATSHVTNIKTNKDTIIVSGTANVDILYSSDNKLVTKCITVPFCEEFKYLGVDSTSKACICIGVATTKVVITGVEDDNTLRLELVLCAVGDVYEYMPMTAISDICSSTNIVDIVREDVTYRGIVGSSYTEERIVGGTEDVESIKKVIATLVAPHVIAKATARDGEIDAEILVPVSVVYISSEEKYEVLDMELPATMTIPAEWACEDDEIDIHVSVFDVVSRAKREHDIDITAELGVEAVGTREMTYNRIAAVKDGGEKPSTHKAISIYVVSSGESMWDIVCGLDMDEEDIRRSNPTIDFDNLVGGEKVVVFRGTKK